MQKRYFSFLLPVALSLGVLQADSLSVHTNLVGTDVVCDGVTSCQSDWGGSRVVATMNQVITNNQIELNGVAAFTYLGSNTPHAYFEGTFTLPSNWDKAVIQLSDYKFGPINSISGEPVAGFTYPGTDELQGTPFLEFHQETYLLGPDSDRQITLFYDVSPLSSAGGYGSFDLIVWNPDLPPTASTPEPATAGLLGVSFLAAGLAGWRKRQ